MTRSSLARKKFFDSIDLSETEFEVKIADFGFSKKLQFPK